MYYVYCIYLLLDWRVGCVCMYERVWNFYINFAEYKLNEIIKDQSVCVCVCIEVVRVREVFQQKFFNIYIHFYTHKKWCIFAQRCKSEDNLKEKKAKVNKCFFLLLTFYIRIIKTHQNKKNNNKRGGEKWERRHVAAAGGIV